jgi:Rrf2 family nitric oxide-sensitive transcriptional repressor
MISQTMEYALRAVAHLAEYVERPRAAGHSRQVAAATEHAGPTGNGQSAQPRRLIPRSVSVEHPTPVCRTVQDIASATGMPAEYLSKVLQELTRAGIVKSQRGPCGGFRLAHDPADITVLSVVKAVSPLGRITECPLGRQDHCAELCRLHRLLDDAVAGVEKAFRQTSIADLLEPQSPLNPISSLRGAQCRAQPTRDQSSRANRSPETQTSQPSSSANGQPHAYENHDHLRNPSPSNL